jgi:hypothetical protein
MDVKGQSVRSVEHTSNNATELRYIAWVCLSVTVRCIKRPQILKGAASDMAFRYVLYIHDGLQGYL